MLTTSRSIELGQLMGWASILMSLWIVLNLTTDGIWIVGAVFPIGTLAFALGMATRQRAYIFLTLIIISLLLICGMVALDYPEGFSLALLIIAGGFINVLVFLLGYTYPDTQYQQTEAEEG
ncbi:hypothetical protein [Halalkalicoccus subterraneus]|uniref:hypothetical protein n=1 Tax=Halalkalicoccus subterraneus TaxID=2675002 RepID=UPI001B860CD2|nr:hypothetical protein [Halalkalicoccus subterraneus]